MAPHRYDALTGVLSRRSLLASLSAVPLLASLPSATPDDTPQRRPLRRQAAAPGPCPVWSPQTTFGSLGGGTDHFNSPAGVAVSSNNLTLWITDTGNSRIMIWTRPDASSAWKSRGLMGGRGSGESQFDHPSGVALSSDELTLWVADTNNNRIAVRTRPDASSTTWSPQTTFGRFGRGADHFHFPYGVAVSTDELTLWVADTNNSRISVWSRPDASSTTWSPQTTFGSFGRFGSDADQFSKPCGVAVSTDALTLWVADTNNSRISVWSRPDASSTTWSPQTTFGSYGSGADHFHFPSGVALSSDDRTLWVADNGNARIAVWASDCPA